MISVIIPAFNRAGSLRRAIQSVRNQDDVPGHEIEIVVVDDCSDPPLMLDHDAGTVKLVRLGKNVGAAGARNAGVEASRGDYIAFLDSDDVWCPGKLCAQMAYYGTLTSTGQAMIVLTCATYYPNRVSGVLEQRRPIPADQLHLFASGCWHCPGSCALMHRSVFECVGPLDQSLRRLEDLDWFIRFGVQGGQLHVSPAAGAIIAPSLSASPEAVRQSARLLLDKYDAQGTTPLPAPARRRLQAYLALEHGAAALQAGQRLAGVAHLMHSFLLKPRWRGALEPFWQRRADVPGDVQQIYQTMNAPE